MHDKELARFLPSEFSFLYLLKMEKKELNRKAKVMHLSGNWFHTLVVPQIICVNDARII